MIQHIYISDADEKYAPPEQPVLRVALVGDVAFLTIGKHEETADTMTFTDEASIGVPAADLVNALKIAVVSNARRSYVRAGEPEGPLTPVNL